METNYEDILNRLRLIESKIENGIIATPNIVVANNGPQSVQEPKKQIVLPKAVPEDLADVAKNWKNIISGSSPLTRAVLAGATPSIGNNNTLLLVFTESMDKEFISQEAHMKELKDVIAKTINKEVEIQTKLITQGKESIEDFPDLTKIFKNIKIEYED